MVSVSAESSTLAKQESQDVNLAKKRPKWRRNYKACLNCRLRKVKCDLGPIEEPHPPPCVRCRREQRECLFTTKVNGNKKIVSEAIVLNDELDAGLQKQAERKLNTSNNSEQLKFSITKPKLSKIDKSNVKLPSLENDSRWRLELTSMQNTLQFLAKAAGSVSRKKASIMNKVAVDHINSTQSTPDCSPVPIVSSSKETAILDLSDENIFAPLLNPNGPQRPTASLIEKLGNVRPKPTKKLTDFEYIGNGKLLTEQEAIEFIDLFFSTMHPFFPHIPLQLQDPAELTQYPILLCAILTISTRYHTFTEFGGFNGEDNKRNISVHERLWDFCQKLISQTIWAEASTRSIGTIFAFIIFTEWNPRQIHWKRNDYANSERDISVRSTEEDEELRGIAAIRRSDRMAWMFTGSAIRLAQDMGFIETSTKVFVSAHMSDAFASMNMNQKSVLAESFSEISFKNSRYKSTNFEENDNDQSDIGNEQFYLEKILSNDKSKVRWANVLQNIQEDSDKHEGGLTDLEREFLNDEYLLYYYRNNDEVVHQQQHRTLPFPLRFSFAQRAKIELIRIILIGYDTIYYEKGGRKLASDDQVHNLAVLSILSPLIEGWYDTYRDLLKSVPIVEYTSNQRKNKRKVSALTKQVTRESILCDYRYCQLYIYSLALQVDSKIQKLRVNEITRSAKYVELAYNAAKEIIYSAERVHQFKLLKYMPVRWVMRIVRAVSFLVKCYLMLTKTSNSSNEEARSILTLCCISLEETIRVIKLAAITLKYATPDELHLSIRYSAILLYLCKEMKLKKERNRKLLLTHGILIKERDSSENSVGENKESTNTYHDESGSSIDGKNDIDNRKSNTDNERHTSANKNNQYSTNGDDNIKNYKTSNLKPDQSCNTNSRLRTNIGIETDGQAVISNLVDDKGIFPQDIPGGIDSAMADNNFEYPSLPDEVTDWFSGSTNIGLGFVEPWTEMLEQRFLQSGGTDSISIDELLQHLDEHDIMQTNPGDAERTT